MPQAGGRRRGAETLCLATNARKRLNTFLQGRFDAGKRGKLALRLWPQWPEADKTLNHTAKISQVLLQPVLGIARKDRMPTSAFLCKGIREMVALCMPKILAGKALQHLVCLNLFGGQDVRGTSQWQGLKLGPQKGPDKMAPKNLEVEESHDQATASRAAGRARDGPRSPPPALTGRPDTPHCARASSNRYLQW